MRKAEPTNTNRRPLNFSSSTSSPARKRRKASPSTERMEIGRSTLTQPSTDGPITIPAIISNTIAGKRRAGVRASKSGARKATMATISNPEKETFGMTFSFFLFRRRFHRSQNGSGGGAISVFDLQRKANQIE